jgi:hypothetical protein
MYINAGRWNAMTCCILCRYSGGSNTTVNEVNQYISQNISVLDIEEIAEQASEMLRSVLEQECTPEQIKLHIHEHTQEPRIVVSMLLRDVKKTIEDVRKSSTSVDENGTVIIDKTNMLLYLKTVEVVASLAMRLNS